MTSFITICVKDFKPAFGEIIDGKMILNDFGLIVKQQWLWLEKQYEYVKLDNFAVMPEHFHGILQIKQNTVGTTLGLSLRRNKSKLSNLICAFKTTSSKKIHEVGLTEFKWQRLFYDRIIRTENEFQNIKWYIKNNPKNYKFV